MLRDVLGSRCCQPTPHSRRSWSERRFAKPPWPVSPSRLTGWAAVRHRYVSALPGDYFSSCRPLWCQRPVTADCQRGAWGGQSTTITTTTTTASSSSSTMYVLRPYPLLPLEANLCLPACTSLSLPQNLSCCSCGSSRQDG
ncbi:hypothetical protein CC78DRAFT_285628 [Lojkania enalia]|uniref:Uncharacterized protein n=1 Tax=Lojkania enalia TaxID=147567 RepID=A0A9P4K8Z0_9PLEO|nr:hypothetical protein CC78DRAFT_285628 [Didymosphaeria enalia]